MTHVFIAFLLLVSGVYNPVDVLPSCCASFRVQPGTYVLKGACSPAGRRPHADRGSLFILPC
jgi:hypothetical protein